MTDKSILSGLKVFISYSRRDSKFRAKLADSLCQQGIEPIYDRSANAHEDPELHLSAQDEWWRQLKSMIAASDVLLFVVTPASAASNVCDDEIAHARSLGKRIIAILRHDIDFDIAPERLRALNVELDFRDDSNFAIAYEALVTELTVDIDWHRRGARLMRQAQQWDTDGRPQWQLLREGAIDDADNWAACRPVHAPKPGPLILDFLAASRKKERNDDDERRRIIGRAFVKPARQMFENRHIIAGMHLTAAGLLLSEDFKMELIPELDQTTGFRQAAFYSAVRSTFHGPVSATFSPDGSRIVTVRDSKPVVCVWDRTNGKLIANLQGHSDWVRMADFSSDGRHVVTASADGTARVWDTERGIQISCLTGHGAHVYSSKFSSDGKLVVTASGDGTARIWDAFTGQEIMRLEGHLSEVTSADFSLDSSRVVTTSMDSTVRIWRVNCKPRLQSLIMHEDETIASLSSDGTQLVTASKFNFRDRVVRIWNVSTGEKIGQFKTEIGNFTVVAFSPDNARILTATMENTASIWDATTFLRLFQLRGHTDSIVAAAFSPDSTKIVTASVDTTAILWDAANGDVLNIFKGHSSRIITTAFCPEGKTIVTGAHDQSVRLWDCSVDNFIAFLQSDDGGNIRNVVFNPDGASILTVGTKAHVWNAETLKEIHCLSDHQNLSSAFFSADGSRIIAVSNDQSIIVWESKSGREILRIIGGSVVRLLGVITIGADSLSPNGKLLVAPLSENNTVGVWNCETGTEIARLPGHADGVQYCLFNPDGTKIITVGDNTVRFWDIASGKETMRLEESFLLTRAVFSSCGERMVVTGVGSFSVWDSQHWSKISVVPTMCNDDVRAEFCPDGSQFVTVCQQVGIVWDSSTGKPNTRLQGNVLTKSISFSPNGDRIAACMPGKLAGIWDIHTGTLIASLPGADASCVALSPDGMWAATGSLDSVVRVWDITRSSALTGPLSVALAANLLAGHGQKSDAESEDLLMQMAPDDLCSALLDKLSEAQRADAMQRATIVARGLHSLCYLPPSRRVQACPRNVLTVQEHEKEQTNFKSDPQLDELAASVLDSMKDGSFLQSARTDKHPGGTIEIVSIRPDHLADFEGEGNWAPTEPAEIDLLPQGHPGKGCPSTLVALLEEATTLASRNEHEASRDLLIVALDASAHLFGPNSLSLVPFLMGLAESYFALGSLMESQLLEERALAIAISTGDEERLDTIRNNLAVTLYNQGEYERARVLLEENVTMLTRTFGPESPQALLAQNNIAETLKSLGKLQEAQDLFESVFKARLSVLGENHPETLRTMYGLASIYEANGDHARAEILYQREISIYATNNRSVDLSRSTPPDKSEPPAKPVA